ncbi:hypothetical protein DBV23_13690 [Edwardsiella ictaluri]|uniref:Enterotoxin-like protein n=3 Tax=Edwardsiella ictaluri TaxID=67780 RepID=C5B8P0_EDWI9|nr:ShET2/EspL2 family type III secretion system effector toxin [Edwardsiella ictaluri]ACR69900.1 enterotoxin-like protein [Edwardsiella ictaluri 93-146]AVZ83166.1 hypothetical protein DBV23_13690 [Edwardsiella ictaluri]EKS7761964.1 ShET2/EspL2 family type III secretion system effector toxin [Edwardsiella ictaluri]EKS7768774.1 ShET2/EspL2 family type III secretion system effector toxin [Edwardsiella ictaluri]EKS7774375.1 ShET2/EspL2 family type III secretion system effector toxin [Edwardsiella 
MIKLTPPPNSSHPNIITDKEDITSDENPHALNAEKPEPAASPICFIDKQKPYFPDKKNTSLNLNCQVRDSFSNLITCRHLSAFWVAQFNQGEGKVNYKHFSSAEALNSNISVIEREASCTAPGVIQLIENKDWGCAIFDTFSDMRLNGDKFRALELSTISHAMALGLKIKNTINKEIWVIYLYDPNHTASHRRAEYSDNNQDDIKKLTAGDFLTKPYLRCHELIPAGVSMLVDRHIPVNTSIITRLPNNLLQQNIIWHAMTMGLTEVIQQVTEKINLSALTLKKREELVIARRRDGTPGLLMALQNGHTDTVLAYGKLLKKAGLPPEKTADLLLAKGEGGASGLVQSMQNGHADTVLAYGKLLKKAGLSPEKTADLLLAKGAGGVSGLAQAMQNGHADTILAYGDVINANAMCFNHDKIVNLLAANTTDDTTKKIPGLFFALQNGHTDAVLAYGELLKAANLSPDETATLLAAKRYDSSPGLLLASQNGYIDVIQAYGELLKDLNLNKAKAAELLAARRDDGISVLFMALYHGNVEIIKSYGMIIDNLKFNPSETEQLLDTGCSNGLNGLFFALSHGYKNAISTYGELICSAKFSPYKVARLLAAKGVNDTPGILMAYQNQHTEAIKSYIMVINDTGVIPYEITEHLPEKYRSKFFEVVNSYDTEI